MGLGYHSFGGVGESEPIVAHHVMAQHSEHFRSGTLDNCYPGQQRGSHGGDLTRAQRAGTGGVGL